MDNELESLREDMAFRTDKILTEVYAQGKRIDKLEEASL